MKEIKLIKLFISCPSDLKPEIDSIKIVVDTINKTSGRQNSYFLECLNWTQDTYTQIGEDAQDVINKQIDSEYDILIGLIWLKVGTPTKRDQSGTIEEINRAIDSDKKEFLIYFKTASPENLNDLDLGQYAKVKSFKSELSQKGVLYKEFDTLKTFESLLQIHLTHLISEKILSPESKVTLEVAKPTPDRYSAISAIIDSIESKEDFGDIDIDIFELTEGLLASFDFVSKSLESMTTTLHDITTKMSKKTKELNSLSHLKDNRLRIQKGQVLVNILASELSDFSKRMESEKSVLIDHFLTIGPKYSQIMSFGKFYSSQDDINLNQSLTSYRDSVKNATEQSAGFLRAISEWPPSTSKFNKSKRETEIILKDITKIFLDGLRLIDEALEN